MVDVVLHAFTTLFVVIDPPGLLPVLLALTPGMAPAVRRRMAFKGTLLATLILLGFALGGEALLGVLGIGLPAFRTAGGVMLLLIALEMVFERRTERRSRSADELKTIGDPDDISAFPLAIPLLAGPGAITSVMLLMARYEGDLAAQAAVVIVLLGVMALLHRDLRADRAARAAARRDADPRALAPARHPARRARGAVHLRRPAQRVRSRRLKPGGDLAADAYPSPSSSSSGGTASTRSRSSSSAEAPKRSVSGRTQPGLMKCSAR